MVGLAENKATQPSLAGAWAEHGNVASPPLIKKSKFRILDFLIFFLTPPPPFRLFPLFGTFFILEASLKMFLGFEILTSSMFLTLFVKIRLNVKCS